jgi:hypothetical protein
MNTLLKIGLVAGAALALSACGSGRPGADAPTPSQAPAPVVAPATTEPAPTESAAPAASTSPTVSPPGSSAASVNPCPVSEKTLLKALKGTDVGRRGGDPTKLIQIKSYRGYAVARDGAPRPGTDAANFLFGFKHPQNVWIALTLGSGGYCDGYVLDRSIRQHLGDGC